MVGLDYLKIGKRIKERRTEKGLTQEYVATKLNVNPSHISNIECGRAHPSLTALVQIANTLSCSVDCFIAHEYKMQEKKELSLDDKIMRKIQFFSTDQKEKMLKILDIL